MTIDEADKQGIITKDEYEKVINHIEEVDRIVNKYNYIAKRICKLWQDKQKEE